MGNQRDHTLMGPMAKDLPIATYHTCCFIIWIGYSYQLINDLAQSIGEMWTTNSISTNMIDAATVPIVPSAASAPNLEVLINRSCQAGVDRSCSGAAVRSC